MHTARNHPDDIGGIVLLDVPAGNARLTARKAPDAAWNHPTNVERVDSFHAERTMARDKRSLGEVPVTVVTADAGQSDKRDQRVWEAAVEQLLAGRPLGRSRHLRRPPGGRRPADPQDPRRRRLNCSCCRGYARRPAALRHNGSVWSEAGPSLSLVARRVSDLARRGALGRRLGATPADRCLISEGFVPAMRPSRSDRVASGAAGSPSFDTTAAGRSLLARNPKLSSRRARFPFSSL